MFFPLLMNYREINCTWLWKKKQIDTPNLHKPNPCAGKNVHESFQRERERMVILRLFCIRIKATGVSTERYFEPSRMEI